jgi:hypothetical protein
MRIEIHCDDHIVRHAARKLRTRNIPGICILFARIADRHVIVERLGDLSQIFRELTCTHDQQPPVRTVHADEHLAIEAELIRPFARCDVDAPCIHLQPANHQFVALHAHQQLVNLALRTERLKHQFERAAARQSEALRLLRGDPITGGSGLVGHELTFPNAVDQVVFDTTA